MKGYAGENNYQFLSRELQLETGLVDLNNRQYNPQTGQFTSQDKITDGQEHLSLYQYGWNNPILKPDPDGLMPDPPTKTSLAIHTGLDAVGLIPGFGEIADGANAVYYLAEGNKTDAGLSVASMIPIAGWFATGAKTIRNVDKAVDVAKAGEKVVEGVKGGEKVMETSKAARREAMREAGIPTSQPLMVDKATKSKDKVFVTRDGKSTVQNAKNDVSHKGEPHWEAGPTKKDPSKPDGLNRSGNNNKPQMAKPKAKVYYNE